MTLLEWAAAKGVVKGAGFVVFAKFVQDCCGRRPGVTSGNSCHRAVGVNPQESEGAGYTVSKSGNEFGALLVPTEVSVSGLQGGSRKRCLPAPSFLENSPSGPCPSETSFDMSGQISCAGIFHIVTSVPYLCRAVRGAVSLSTGTQFPS